MKLHIIVGDMLKSELPFFDVCIANSCRTRSPHLSCSSCCCCCIETSITVPKESVPATPVNQLHHMTNRTITASHPPRPHSQPPTYIPDSAIRCRQRRQQYSEPHVHISMGHVRDKLRHRRRHHRFSPSRTQRQGGRSAFVNSGRTDGRIRTGPSPFDAPKRRNDDGMCHVAPRVTGHVPRATAWTLTKTSAGAKFSKGRSPRPQTCRVSAP